MDRSDMRVGLVSAPGTIRNSTCATIVNTPNLHLVVVVSGALSATQVVQGAQLDLILFDANIPEDEMSALLNWLSDHLPSVRTLAARMTSERCRQAIALGADDAVRRDELPQRLCALARDDSDWVETGVGRQPL